MNERGSRRRQAKRAEQARRAKAEGAKPPSRFWLWFRRLFLWGMALALLGLLFLGIAVAFAARSLPSFYQLKATQNAQTIVVRARDGTEDPGAWAELWRMVIG